VNRRERSAANVIAIPIFGSGEANPLDRSPKHDATSHPQEIASVAKKAPLPTGRQDSNPVSKTSLRPQFLDWEKQSHFFM